MKISIYYKNGKTETFDFKEIDFICAVKWGIDICLNKPCIKPPAGYKERQFRLIGPSENIIKQFRLNMKDIEKFEILNKRRKA